MSAKNKLVQTTAVVPRVSARFKTRPTWWSGYDMNVKPATAASTATTIPLTGSSSKFDIDHYLQYHSFDPAHHKFLAHISHIKEPSHYSIAATDPQWVNAMTKELEALEANDTWKLVPLPNGKVSVGCKWVYKVKYKANGDVDRYKARMVAKRYTQAEGIDYHDTFAPVAKMVTVKCVVAIAAARGWQVHQMDVNNAFLHGDFLEEVYMNLPQGYIKSSDSLKLVCKLQKSLYGLFTVMVVNVNDILVTGNDVHQVHVLKNMFDKRFSIKDLGEIKYYLGFDVFRDSKGIFISQRKLYHYKKMAQQRQIISATAVFGR